MSSALVLEDVNKVYERNVTALLRIDLRISEGEFVTLLGPSGSGKTSLLMVIAGFENPTSGRIIAKGLDITGLPPERRNFGIVFQSYALFPHMTVGQNISYPLGVRKVPRTRRLALVKEVLSLVGLQGLSHRRPSQLSGGQQQRVALARALVYKPSVLLLDEPLGALDRAFRERMQLELSNLHKKVGVTFLYVTHDQDEALTMSDRVVVLRSGSIEQVGTPEEIYAQPATPFVASFVGRANLLPGRVVGSAGRLARIQLDCGPSVDVPCPASPNRDQEAIVVIRPEKVRIAAQQNAGDGRTVRLAGRLESESFAGSVRRYTVSTAWGEFQAHTTRPADVAVGGPVWIEFDPAESWAIPSDGNRESARSVPA